jgi:hypothetical protein
VPGEIAFLSTCRTIVATGLVSTESTVNQFQNGLEQVTFDQIHDKIECKNMQYLILFAPEGLNRQHKPIQ